MADIIQLLPDHVANQIAAGEVVQRPSSVVKELLENAIDAHANEVTLLIKDAGKSLIQVIDNGKGMTASDARMCFERHATSKIKDAKDLFNLHTKGFRGEALASIAAVSHVELKTKTANEELGRAIKNEGNTITLDEVVQTATGTSIAVKNLFYNIPARRNFLKSDTVETRHIIDEFHRVALVHSEVSFNFYHNNKEVYILKSDRLKKRIIGVFGFKMDLKLVPIREQTDILTVEGFVAKPEFSKKKRGEQFFFVNDRFIKSSYLHHAIVNAFEGLIDPGSHPSYFLYLQVPTDSIDINIHPTKTEIKFDNEKAIYAMLRASVKHSLGQYNVTPVLDFNRDASLDTPYEFKDKKPTTPIIKVDPSFNPFKENFEYTKQTDDRPIKSGNHSQEFISKIKDVGSWGSLYPETDQVDGVGNFTEPSQEKLFQNDIQDLIEYKTYQLQNKYILSSLSSGNVLIHQSRAHHRVLYDELIVKFSDQKIESQQLLFPLTISLPKEDVGTIYSIKNELESTGFVFNEFTMESIVIGGAPTMIKETEITLVIEQILDDLRIDIPDSNFDYVAKMACSLSRSLCIKTGTKLNFQEQEKLVNDLFCSSDPSVSPEGKLIIKTLSINDVDKIFNT